MDELLEELPYYRESGGGVTFSGGECMLQLDFLEEVLRCLKEKGIHTAVDTAGNVPFEDFERILPYTDLFLYDMKAFHEAVSYTHLTIWVNEVSKIPISSLPSREGSIFRLPRLTSLILSSTMTNRLFTLMDRIKPAVMVINKRIRIPVVRVRFRLSMLSRELA